ncbi:MAG: ATP-binding protein [Alphaproteobacteria bacterium]|nr:ATP-binding protein [Alphaproteobacteria bacterium]
MISRKEVFQNILKSRTPIVALLGPGQCGKSTIAAEFRKKYQPKAKYFDLDDPDDEAAFANPKLLLDHLSGWVIIDEVQRAPNLFPYLRRLVDKNKKIRLLLLGNAVPELIQKSAESLVGRIHYIEITPFTLGEIAETKKLLLRGGYPNSFLSRKDTDANSWLKSYIKTYLERDIANLGFSLRPQLLRRFLVILADYSGQIFNASELARNLGVSYKTVQSYVGLFEGCFMVRALQPWLENISKRQVKSPKIYFRDSGLLNCLLDISSHDELLVSRKISAIWEGFVIEQVIKKLNANPQECYFWSSQTGAEIDLLIMRGKKKFAFEVKYVSKPQITKSMLSSLESLRLKKLIVIVPGKASHKLSKQIEVCGIENLIKKKDLKKLF